MKSLNKGVGGTKKIFNARMIPRPSDMSYEECMEINMSPAQNEVFLVIDEWWKKYHYAPTLRDIAYIRGKMGLANTKRLVDRLVDLGVVKKIEKRGRTVRPVYINFRNLE
jgi:SOS-response transcriptional repressor LexA